MTAHPQCDKHTGGKESHIGLGQGSALISAGKYTSSKIQETLDDHADRRKK